MKAGFFITAHSNVAHPLRRRVVAVNDSLGVPPSQMRPGSRFPLQVRTRRSSSLAGFSLQSLTRALLLFSICIVGCSRSVPFEKDGWQKKFDGDYPNRDAMVHDLLNNHPLTGLTTQAVTELLGEEDHISLVEKPKTADRRYMAYQVLEDFGWDIDPVHTKYLILEFNEDSIVTKVDLLEWER